VAITSITFAPARRGTETVNEPPALTCAPCPRTWTAALAGSTDPRTFTTSARTVAVSAGSLSCSVTGFSRGAALGSSPPQPSATSAAARHEATTKGRGRMKARSG
jgi:hypothetical protein